MARAVPKGWGVRYFGTVDPYSCPRCKPSWGDAEEYWKIPIGPIKVSKLQPCNYKEVHTLGLDFMAGSAVVQPELGARIWEGDK